MPTPSSRDPFYTVMRFRRLRPGARVPEYQTALAAGMDLSACLDAPVTIEPGRIALIPCGFAMALAPGWEAQVRPRSGLASRHGVTLPNAPGTIDADYRGEVRVALINLGLEPFTVEPGMRIAQLVIAPVAHADVQETDDLDAPWPEVVVRSTKREAARTRGEGGFGSTGV
ncbi:MAG: dUTP diphosphatase [Phycisphaerales bacterium]|nr:dUTP diphosphatase [Phycisphaerales bacterium]